jgi:hypothetical protein
MFFNKNRESTLAKKPESDCPSSHFLKIELAQRNQYERPRLTTKKSSESVRSAAGRRKARLSENTSKPLFDRLPAKRGLGVQETQASRSDVILLPALVIFTYLPLIRHK